MVQERAPASFRPELIAGLVGPMLGELDRESAKRRPVHAGEEPFNHSFGDDLDTTQASDFGRIEKI